LAKTPSKWPAGSRVQEVLLPDLAPGVLARHPHELVCALEPDRHVSEIAEHGQVPPWPTPQVENRVRRWPEQVPDQRVDVLTHVVVARPFPEALGAPVVVRQRDVGDASEVVRIEHGRPQAFIS
jgi:hypothetical protein